MSYPRSGRLPAAPAVPPEILVQKLKVLGVNAETARSITEQVRGHVTTLAERLELEISLAW